MNFLDLCLRMGYTLGVLVDNRTVEHVSVANCMVSSTVAGSMPAHAQTCVLVDIPVRKQRPPRLRSGRVPVVVDMKFLTLPPPLCSLVPADCSVVEVRPV